MFYSILILLQGKGEATLRVPEWGSWLLLHINFKEGWQPDHGWIEKGDTADTVMAGAIVVMSQDLPRAKLNNHGESGGGGGGSAFAMFG